MLDFDEKWFEGEEIDGFYVEPMMKRAWAAELELLSEIDRICVKHGLRYYADWGTLLGAVRHGGFIPWDDDIDISMPRQDLMLFAKVAPTELPEGWSYHDCYNSTGYYKTLRRVITSDTIDFGEERLGRFHGFPYPVGIDITPMDYIPADEEERAAQKDMYVAAMSAMNVWLDLESSDEDKQKYAEYVRTLLGVNINMNGDMPTQFIRLADAVASMYGPDDTDMAGQVHYIATGASKPRPADEYFSFTRFKFENVTIPVQDCYDEILTEWYGDYMKKVRQPSSHDYPFYRRMEEMVRGMV